MGNKKLPLMFFISTIVVLFGSLLTVFGGTVFGLYTIGPTFAKVLLGIHIVVLVIGALGFVIWGKKMLQTNNS